MLCSCCAKAATFAAFCILQKIAWFCEMLDCLDYNVWSVRPMSVAVAIWAPVALDGRNLI